MAGKEMKLDLSEVLHHVGKRLSYDIDEPAIVDEDIECCEQITGKLIFTNTGEVLLIDGKASTTAIVQCGRCLIYYKEPIELEISEQFTMVVKPHGPRSRGQEVFVEEEVEAIAGKLFAGPIFDLTELLRQMITLALPMRPLHDENCKGLCVQCGHDLNTGLCSCPQKPLNPAFESLGELLKKKSEGS